jgi:hypothetical protein
LPADRAICSDDGSGHSLDTIELGRVLSKTADKLGQPLDLLGMDACLMSCLEVAYQARPYVRYLVASEESEPGDGWPYDAILRKLVGRPKLPTSELAKHIVNTYIQSYVDRDYQGRITQSALDLSKLDTLTLPMDGLADALIARMPQVQGKIWEAQRRSARFWHNTLWDLNHFCLELESLTARTPTRRAAEAVRKALRKGSARPVLAEAHRGAGLDKCGGLSIYLPALTQPSRYYKDLAFAQDHRWDEMLTTYQPG